MEILKDQRTRIDDIDDQIIRLLVARFEIVREVGSLKNNNNIAVVQHDRVEEVKNRVAALAEAGGLDGNLLRDIYTLIIDHAHRLEGEK